jgi:hypothetical protein
VFFEFVSINEDQAIHTVVESRIDIEIKKDYTSGFAEFGVLLIERWYRSAEIVEQQF